MEGEKEKDKRREKKRSSEQKKGGIVVFEEGRTELRNKTSEATANTSRASLQAGMKGRRW